MRLLKVKSDYIINNYVDTETGEMLQTTMDVKHHKIVVDDRETFAFQYSSIMGVFKELSGRDIKVLTYCSLNSERGTNRISLTKVITEEIATIYDTSYNSVKNSITVLKKKMILMPLGSGTYRINPRYYWKGSSDERKKTMKYILEIECPFC